MARETGIIASNAMVILLVKLFNSKGMILLYAFKDQE